MQGETPRDLPMPPFCDANGNRLIAEHRATIAAQAAEIERLRGMVPPWFADLLRGAAEAGHAVHISESQVAQIDRRIRTALEAKDG